jgi:hypothetical protein
MLEHCLGLCFGAPEVGPVHYLTRSIFQSIKQFPMYCSELLD